MHLPSLPTAKDNILGRLLISPDTANELGWALLEQVDPSSTVDGVSLLQAFCQQRKRSDHTIHGTKDPKTQPLPTSLDEPWPDPRTGPDGKWTDQFPSPEMWIMAHLVCNGPDPFAWRTEDSRDVLDFVVQWNNPQLLDQLLRMPSCPAPSELEKRFFEARRMLPWMHGLAAQDKYAMLEVLIQHGFNPSQRAPSGDLPLHHAQGPRTLAALLNAGVDPLAQDKAGEYAPARWSKVALSRHNTAYNATQHLAQKLQMWSPLAIAGDPKRAAAAIAPVLFEALGCQQGISILNTASQQHGIPVEDWIHPQSGRSIVCTLARDSLRSAKSSLIAPLKVLVEAMDRKALLTPRQSGLSDLAWGWLACRNHGDSKEGWPYLAKLVARLGDAETENAATLWQEVDKLVAWKIPANQTKLEEAVQTACTREMHALADDRSVFARKGDLSPRLEALVNDPQRLIEFARWPLDDSGVGTYAGIAREMAISHPHLAEHAMVGVASVLLRFEKPSARVSQVVFNALGGFLKEGVQWNASLENAPQALLAIENAGRSHPDLGDVASQVIASRIQAATEQAAPSASSRPRL